ncbi:TonB-dependent receptor [Pedobacter aquae]|uniref:TonB-dependent receptor n=1 Tax=Pedobacter aquae TaxID=2605747 RepID=A0A5C0VKE7_9SPHI|nr:TonB-dependent receptor [Pedobacter aquae]QEK52332.1 TonB-dependent receptor [Pedobacter aquae]
MKKLVQSLFILLFIAVNAIAQERTVTGTVTSAGDKLPLPGVSVRVKGANTSTQTNFDGKFTLKVPSSTNTLTFSFIGFVTKDVSIPNSGNLNVTLEEDAKQLSEVVVVAYGSAKKEAITGSVATLNASAIENRVVTNITNVLAGVAPGIQIGATNGQPGTSSAVRIRGFGSISASNSPLYVLDGSVYDGNIGDINANDIESVSLLKDASSSALYGARGANGVIIINTKRGKLGESKLNVNVTQGFSERGIEEYETVGAYDYYPLYWQALRNSRVYPRPGNTALTPAAAATFASNNTPTQLVYNPFNVPANQILDASGKMNPNATLLYNDFDWFAPLERTGSRTNADLSYSGSNGKSDYFVSLGYLNDKGYLEKSDFRRFNARMNVNTQVKKWFKTGLNLAGNLSDASLAQDASTDNAASFVNPFQFSRNMGPIYPVRAYNSTGQPVLTPTGQHFYDYGQHPGAVNRPAGASPGRHVIYETLLNDVLNKRVALNARTYAEIKFLKDFTFRPSVNIDLRQSNSTEFRNPIVGDGNGSNGFVFRRNDLTTSYTFNQILTYDKSFGKHNINVLAGHENYDYLFQRNDASKVNQASAGNTEFANFVTPLSTGGFRDTYRIESYLSKASYNYDEKYFFDASLRRDGSSRFSKDARFGTFFSLGGSWSINKESFMEKATWIDDLRLKASFGEVGNDNLDSYYNYQALYDLGFNNNTEPGYLLSSLPTPNLKWETIQTLNVGVAFSLFKSRLTGELEVFNRATTDLLFSVPLPLSNPVTSIRQNVGNMSNKGIELQLGGDLIRKKNFTWNILTNSSIIRNEITKLPAETPTITAGTKRYEVGQDLYQFYLRQYAGVDPSDGSALFIPTATATTELRTIDGKTYTTNFNNAEFAYMGSAIPDLFGAVTNTFNYKNLQLSVLINYQIGGKFYDGQYAGLMAINTYGKSLHTDALNAWTETNTNSPFPRLDVSSSTFFTAQSSRWLIDASYLSISNVNLSYTLPKKYISKLDLSNVRVFASGENLALFAKRKGLNPTEAFTGVNSTTYVPSRTVVFGLSVNL